MRRKLGTLPLALWVFAPGLLRGPLGGAVWHCARDAVGLHRDDCGRLPAHLASVNVPFMMPEWPGKEQK